MNLYHRNLLNLLKTNSMRALFITLLLFFFSCNHLIKNEEAKVEDEIVDSKKSENNTSLITDETMGSSIIQTKEDLIGTWVGWFEKVSGKLDDYDDKRNVVLDEYMWGRENKISISIDKIDNDKITGHSVVAGNYRPFVGTIKESNYNFDVQVKEPGDDRYDGEFNFSAKKNSTSINGMWDAYRKIEIPKREYSLSKKIFKYNPDQMLSQSSYKNFCDWEKKSKKEKEIIEDDTYIYESYVSATDKIFEINASTTELTKVDVENLTKGDLLVIRNMIYARHGYSFKNRPLRVFFDAQEWYIPVNTDIKKDLTEIEKKNIQLLLKYEKNAKEYYDYFGRG